MGKQHVENLKKRNTSPLLHKRAKCMRLIFHKKAELSFIDRETRFKMFPVITKSVIMFYYVNTNIMKAQNCHIHN